MTNNHPLFAKEMKDCQFETKSRPDRIFQVNLKIQFWNDFCCPLTLSNWSVYQWQNRSVFFFFLNNVYIFSFLQKVQSGPGCLNYPHQMRHSLILFNAASGSTRAWHALTCSQTDSFPAARISWQRKELKKDVSISRLVNTSHFNLWPINVHRPFPIKKLTDRRDTNFRVTKNVDLCILYSSEMSITFLCKCLEESLWQFCSWSDAYGF